ncbi:hypothetical protein RPW65_07220 [Pseudomonas sp. NyZ704]|nr:hypothetical protein RPW65_07220 [Pseudomonas sp. NyZ704]
MFAAANLAHFTLDIPGLSHDFCLKLGATLALLLIVPLSASANSDAESKLLAAVGRDDCSAVQTQLDAGASANVTFEDMLSLKVMPVMFMAASGSACVAEALIQHGADIDIVLHMPYNTPDKSLVSPLAAAIGIGNVPVVEVLLASGAQTQLLDSQGHDLIPVYIDGLNTWIEPKRSPGTIAQITQLLEQAEKN